MGSVASHRESLDRDGKYPAMRGAGRKAFHRFVQRHRQPERALVLGKEDLQRLAENSKDAVYRAGHHSGRTKVDRCVHANAQSATLHRFMDQVPAQSRYDKMARYRRLGWWLSVRSLNAR